MNKWEKSKYHIVVGQYDENGNPLKILVHGEVNGHFGIHGNPYDYHLTHIPTGRRMNQLLPGLTQPTKKNLRAIVKKIGHLDWSHDDLNKLKELKPICEKLIDEGEF